MNNTLLKLVPVCVALALGGCATTTFVPVNKYGVTQLRNPQTGRALRCAFREGPQITPADARMAEANYEACIRNARAFGYTHEVLVIRYP
jgi:hypothetical protein